MNTPTARPPLEQYPLLQALRNRRSRRVPAGGHLPAGPLAFRSALPVNPLTGEQEAALAFAACGITGRALGDWCYAPGEGGNMLAGLVGRTAASGDAIQSVAVAVTNDEGAWLLKRPQDFLPAEIPELIAQGRRGEFTALYRRSRIQLRDGRAQPPTTPLFNLNCNRWSAHAPGSTAFLPISELTFLYINGLLEVLNETTGAFPVDERAGFRPAGVGRFARSRGGHLEDDARAGRIATIRQIETMVAEFAALEQGMILQNLALMAEALGLAGFPSFANHDFAWFEALGFQMRQLPASQYLGTGWLTRMGLRLLNRDVPVPLVELLARDGRAVMQPYCPPRFPSMREAVLAVVDAKFGPDGLYRSPGIRSAWRDDAAVRQAVPPLSQAAIDATIAYCEYVWGCYGRFPAHLPPFRTVLVYQAHQMDPAFYHRFYA